MIVIWVTPWLSATVLVMNYPCVISSLYWSSPVYIPWVHDKIIVISSSVGNLGYRIMRNEFHFRYYVTRWRHCRSSLPLFKPPPGPFPPLLHCSADSLRSHSAAYPDPAAFTTVTVSVHIPIITHLKLFNPRTSSYIEPAWVSFGII